jgi:hypothetical protein
MPLVQARHNQAYSQRPEESPPRGITQVSMEGPEPEKIEGAIGYNMAGFAEIEVEKVYLGQAQGWQPGQQPIQDDPGIVCGPHVPR